MVSIIKNVYNISIYLFKNISAANCTKVEIKPEFSVYTALGMPIKDPSMGEYSSRTAAFVWIAICKKVSSPCSVTQFSGPYSVTPFSGPYSLTPFSQRYSVTPFSRPYSRTPFSRPYSRTPFGRPYSVTPFSRPFNGTLLG